MKKFLALSIALAMVAVATTVDASPPPVKDAPITITAPAVVVDSAELIMITAVPVDHILFVDVNSVVCVADSVQVLRTVASNKIASRNRYRWCGLNSNLPASHSLIYPLLHSTLFASSWRT